MRIPKKGKQMTDIQISNAVADISRCFDELKKSLGSLRIYEPNIVQLQNKSIENYMQAVAYVYISNKD